MLMTFDPNFIMITFSFLNSICGPFHMHNMYYVYMHNYSKGKAQFLTFWQHPTLSARFMQQHKACSA